MIGKLHPCHATQKKDNWIGIGLWFCAATQVKSSELHKVSLLFIQMEITGIWQAELRACRVSGFQQLSRWVPSVSTGHVEAEVGAEVSTRNLSYLYFVIHQSSLLHTDDRCMTFVTAYGHSCMKHRLLTKLQNKTQTTIFLRQEEWSCSRLLN